MRKSRKVRSMLPSKTTAMTGKCAISIAYQLQHILYAVITGHVDECPTRSSSGVGDHSARFHLPTSASHNHACQICSPYLLSSDCGLDALRTGIMASCRLAKGAQPHFFSGWSARISETLRYTDFYSQILRRVNFDVLHVDRFGIYSTAWYRLNTLPRGIDSYILSAANEMRAPTPARAEPEANNLLSSNG